MGPEPRKSRALCATSVQEDTVNAARIRAREDAGSGSRAAGISVADILRFPHRLLPGRARNDHRATFFRVVGPSGRPLTCAAFAVQAGLELRLSCDNVLWRSQLFRDGCEEQLLETASIWRAELIQSGFIEQE